MSRDDEIGRFCGLKKKVAPLCGFGEYGEGYFRLTTFNTYEATAEAMRRINEIL